MFSKFSLLHFTEHGLSSTSDPFYLSCTSEEVVFGHFDETRTVWDHDQKFMQLCSTLPGEFGFTTNFSVLTALSVSPLAPHGSVPLIAP